MRTRLQRHIERGPARRLACAPQRLGLGMRPAAGLGPAAADNDAVLHHDRAYGRIGPGASLPAATERQRQLHGTQVGGFGVAECLPELVFQDTEDHFRIAASRLSSSPVSSPSTASKSLASRKLRY